MPEIPDVATLTTISIDWGNDIRDRTIQRYSSVSNRTSEHPSPAEGDLAYLSDSNTVWVYTGAAWVQLVPGPVATANIDDQAVTGAKLAGDAATGFEVDNSTEVASYVLTGAYANAASITLTIPAGWGSWKCEAYATYAILVTAGSAGIYDVRFSIDGTATQAQETLNLAGDTRGPGSLGGRRTGMTTTGSRTIAFQAMQTSGVNPATMADIYLYARAVRTS